MVNPGKTAAQVNTESLEGKELYKVSHNDLDVGKFRNDYWILEFYLNTNANAVIWLAEPLHTISHQTAVAWCALQN